MDLSNSINIHNFWRKDNWIFTNPFNVKALILKPRQIDKLSFVWINVELLIIIFIKAIWYHLFILPVIGGRETVITVEIRINGSGFKRNLLKPSDLPSFGSKTWKKWIFRLCRCRLNLAKISFYELRGGLANNIRRREHGHKYTNAVVKRDVADFFAVRIV